MNVLPPPWGGEIRRNFWSVTVCDSWNNLPDEVKKVETLKGFKNAADNHMSWRLNYRDCLTLPLLVLQST